MHPSGLQRSVSLPLNRGRSPPGRTPATGSVGRGTQGGGEGLAENEPMVLLRSSPMKEESDSSAVELAAAPTHSHRRRGALRYNRRAFSHDAGQGPHLSPYFRPRNLSAGTTSYAASALAAHRAAVLAVSESARLEEQEERDEDQPRKKEEEEDEPNPLVESVKHTLLEQGHLSLLDVVEKMPTSLHESIVMDCVSRSCLETITNRVPELQSGHLAHADSDSSRGAIHWFEGEA